MLVSGDTLQLGRDMGPESVLGVVLSWSCSSARTMADEEEGCPRPGPSPDLEDALLLIFLESMVNLCDNEINRVIDGQAQDSPILQVIR